MTTSDKSGQTDTITRVYAVCDKMLREGRGREITSREVHKAINYGSMKTINDAIASWWEVHGMQVGKLEQLGDLPPEIVSSLIDVVHQLGNAANDKAEARYEAKHQEAQQLIEKAETEQSKAVERLDESQDRVKELEFKCRLQLEEIEHLSQDLSKSETERQTINGEIKQIRQDAADKVSQVEKRLQELELTLTKENRRFDEMQNHYAKTIDVERTERKNDAARYQKTITDLNKDISDLQNNFVEIKSTSRVQEKVDAEKITLLKSEINQLDSALEKVKVSNINYQKTIAELTTELRIVESRMVENKKKYDNRKQQYQDLQQKTAALENQIKELKSKNNK